MESRFYLDNKRESKESKKKDCHPRKVNRSLVSGAATTVSVLGLKERVTRARRR